MTTFVLLLPVALLFAGCKSGDGPGQEDPSKDPFEAKRWAMVERQLADRDITDKLVLDAMRTVPRHRFMPEDQWEEAYEDHPVPIGYKQTISQPYIVALMTQAIQPRAGMRILEVGTGSGYQAAVLAQIGAEVYTIEIVEPLGRRAEKALADLGYDKVHVKVGDGYYGWPGESPFDAVIITAAPPKVPETLLEQLAVGGVLVVPEGDFYQQLRIYRRTKDGFDSQDLIPVRFVPMTGRVRE